MAKPAQSKLPLPQVLEKGEWPTLERLTEEDEAAVATTAAGLDEGLTEPPNDHCDELTPDNLIGDHRDGEWATREDEEDRGTG